MTLRRITFDNSVKYIAQSERTRDSEPNTIKNNSLPEKQNKIISQNKKIILNLAAEKFRILK